MTGFQYKHPDRHHGNNRPEAVYTIEHHSLSAGEEQLLQIPKKDTGRPNGPGIKSNLLKFRFSEPYC